ncbi:MAG TPA: Gfo/Idh/MocA family oxidoreductase [Candidatus Hydrogenedentes bacterium]|nr:Gfo/Idh/MocA family oxidoreductase [Candidatus Hydrogenedentota bacterium]HPO86888.1 Gfo/Idh/MocA family oxidoreductase [Candidatus Hydrogenedentota bacterium]
MEKVGYGIIGCGAIAPVHARSLAEIPEGKLVAVSDVVKDNAERLAQEFGAIPYTDYREMLKRDDIQAVSLCVPSGLRVEIAEACAAAGKHILAEKPLEVTVERIDRMIRAADEAGVYLGCVFQSRFADGAAKLREAIDTGRFGKLVLGDAYIKWYRTQEYYQSGAWRGTRKLDGGGALMNQGIHQVDLLLWYMGQPRTVHAQTALVGHEGLEVEDLACVTLTFENGAMGVIEASTAIWPGHDARIEVHGTEGSVILEAGEIKFWKFKNEFPEDETIRQSIGKEAALGSGAGDPLSNLKHEGHRRQIQDFIRAILEKRPPRVQGKEARLAVEVIEAAYRSAATGKTVELTK